MNYDDICKKSAQRIVSSATIRFKWTSSEARARPTMTGDTPAGSVCGLVSEIQGFIIILPFLKVHKLFYYYHHQ